MRVTTRTRDRWTSKRVYRECQRFKNYKKCGNIAERYSASPFDQTFANFQYWVFIEIAVPDFASVAHPDTPAGDILKAAVVVAAATTVGDLHPG